MLLHALKMWVESDFRVVLRMLLNSWVFPFTNLSRIQINVSLLLELLPIVSQSWNFCKVLSKRESICAHHKTDLQRNGRSASVLSVALRWPSVGQRSMRSTGTPSIVSALVGRNFSSSSDQVNGLLLC